ncbi:MAG: MazG-like family protein [Bacillota bacterium]
MIQKDFDVARNLKMTEDLQCTLLARVSDLFSSMNEKGTKAEQLELLAELQLAVILLSGKLGISKDALDQKAISKIKLELVKEERSEWKTALLETLATLSKK